MIALVIFLTCLFVAVAVGALASWSDIKGLTIPNWHSIVVIAAFFVCFAFMHLFGHSDVFKPLLSHLIAGGIVFLITACLFAAKTMGAADSKLSTAFAFWMGLSALPAFLFYMTLAGGIIAIGAITIGKLKPFKSPSPGSWVARVQGGENKVPYGVAIYCGALACFVKLGYFNETILSFLS